MHDTQVDYLVVGAGPAGLQLAYFLERAGHSYLVLEKADQPGTFFDRFPRHRKFLSINKVHTGIPASGRSSGRLTFAGRTTLPSTTRRIGESW